MPTIDVFALISGLRFVTPNGLRAQSDLHGCFGTHCRRSSQPASQVSSDCLPRGNPSSAAVLATREDNADYRAKWYPPLEVLAWAYPKLTRERRWQEAAEQDEEDVKLSHSRMDLGIAPRRLSMPHISGQPTSCSGDFDFGEADWAKTFPLHGTMTPNPLLSSCPFFRISNDRVIFIRNQELEQKFLLLLLLFPFKGLVSSIHRPADRTRYRD